VTASDLIRLTGFASRAVYRYLEYERIAQPLSADGETVNMILRGYHVERAS